MGEEQKKPEEEKPEKVEEPKKVDEVKKEEAPKAEEEKKVEEVTVVAAPPPPPPPPQVIILQVYMHCEGCARKVRRSLKGFPGVEDVQTDCKTHKVVVKGEKADPLKVLERVQRKSHRQVALLSPIPKPQAVEEPKKVEEKEVVKAEEKKEEPQVLIAVLSVHMHCEACAQEIKKRIQKMKGVENVEPDLKNSKVIVKGIFDPPKLVEFIYKRTGKKAKIVKVEPEKKEEEKPKEGKEEKKAEESGEKEAKKVEEGGDDKAKKEGDKEAGGEEPPPPPPKAAEGEAEGDAGPEQAIEDPKMELKKNEFYYYQPQNFHHQQLYPQRYVQEMYAYPPQIFSDENPNACSIM